MNTSDIPIGMLDITLPDMSEVGTKQISIKYNDFEIEFSIEIIAVELIGIELYSLPRKTVYEQYDEFDIDELAGLNVVEIYNNQNKVQIYDYELSVPDLSVCGKQIITISYKGFEVFYEIVVIEPEIKEIILAELPTKLIYETDEGLDLSGLIVKIVYVNGINIIIDDYEISEIDMSIAGVHTVQIKYYDYSAEFNITINEQEQIIGIYIAENPKKTIYEVNEELNLSGLIVMLKYSSEREEQLNDFSLDNADMSTSGFKEVKIKYNGFEASFEVLIIQEIGLELSGNYKTSFFAGDDFDYSELKAWLMYSDGSKKEVSSFEVDEPDMTTAGIKTVQIKYSEYTIKYEIIIYEVIVSDIELILPIKLEYFINEALDLTGLKVFAIYNNGAKTILNENEYITNIPSMSANGTKTVVISYLELSVGFDIIINPLNEELTSISIITLPSKLTYEKNDAITLSGLIVLATYNSERDEIISDYTYDLPSTVTVGKKEVIIRYKDCEVSFEILVIEKTGIELSGDFQKSFYVGDVFNYTGLVVSLVYSDGSKKPIVSFNVSNPNLSQAGTKTITVTYGEFTKTYDIIVIAVESVGIEISANPDKIRYYSDEQFDQSGLQVSLILNNNARQPLYTGYTISEPDMHSEGVATITVLYNSFSTEFEIIIIGIDRIELEGSYKTSYTEGDGFDLSGLIVKIYYTDMTNKNISSYSITNPDMSVLGIQTINIEYFGYNTSFDITINQKYSALNIKTMPNKTKYYIGEELNTTGIEVVAIILKNSLEEVLSVDCLIFSALENNSSGTKTITISYKYLSVSFNVTVLDYIQESYFEFILNADKSSYSVKAVLGAELPYEILLPSLHYDLPVTSIIANGFEGEQIGKLIIAEGYTKLDSSAFINCANLTYVSIPSTLTVISENVFKNCVKLSRVIFNDRDSEINIHASAFNNISKYIVFCADLSDINALTENIGLQNYKDYFTSESIEGKVVAKFYSMLEFLGMVFFDSENPLEAIIIEKEEYEFVGWFDNAELEGNAQSFPIIQQIDIMLYAKWTIRIIEQEIIDGNLKFTLNADGQTYSVSAISDANFNGTLTIPSSINGFTVNEILADGFRGLDLGIVIIAPSILIINEYAFYGTKITEVRFEESSQLVGILSYAFAYSSGFSKISLPNSLEYVRENVFDGCTALKTIEFGESIQSIGKDLFSGVFLDNLVINTMTPPEILCTANILACSPNLRIYVPDLGLYRELYQGYNFKLLSAYI